MKSFPFEYSEELQLIVVLVAIDDYDVRLAVDTGASKTVVDFTELMMAGYRQSQAIGIEEFETGKGNIQASVYRVQEIEALGITYQNFEISSYDFLANGVLSDIQGVLGLDFFAEHRFCIDLKKRLISIS